MIRRGHHGPRPVNIELGLVVGEHGCVELIREAGISAGPVHLTARVGVVCRVETPVMMRMLILVYNLCKVDHMFIIKT